MDRWGEGREKPVTYLETVGKAVWHQDAITLSVFWFVPFSLDYVHMIVLPMASSRLWEANQAYY